MQEDFTPDSPFEGLTFWQWLKVILQTRARTLKQCDEVTDLLMRGAARTCEEREGQKALNIELSRLVLIQNSALIATLKELPQGKARSTVIRAINTSKAKI